MANRKFRKSMDQYFQTALKLHQYLVSKHWNGQALIGPDPGIRFNYRIGRFIKSYLRGVHWNDDLYYLQAQGYWVLANWQLFARTGKEKYAGIALRCSEYMVTQQRDDGAWEYPNPEWKGRIATAEGTWGSLGLLETYRQTSDGAFLRGALRWHKFLVETIGFQQVGDELSVNYFAYRTQPRVPNNSAFVLRFVAELAVVTGDTGYLHPCVDLLTFMDHVQKPTGEFPYSVAGVNGGTVKPHFQCYQYNAFQCLDLIRYYELIGDAAILLLIRNVLNFLSEGLDTDGHAFYECGNRHREVTYHTAVLGAAFAKANQQGIEGYDHLANRAYSYLVGLQQANGGFSYSRRDYHLLSDQRSYPRYLAMILHHLLLKHFAIQSDVARKKGVREDVR